MYYFTPMLITNFTAGLNQDLYLLWDGAKNVKAWKSIDDVPECHKIDAKCCRRVAITKPQYELLSKEYNA